MKAFGVSLNTLASHFEELSFSFKENRFNLLQALTLPHDERVFTALRLKAQGILDI